MNKTKIDWVKNPDGTQGYTWNPITGCLNHTNGLCNGGGFPCYAYRLANGRLKQRYLANHNVAPLPNGYGKDFSLSYKDLDRLSTDPFYPRFWEDRLLDVPYSEKPKGIFVCDMSDLFGIGIPHWWTKSVLDMTLMHPDCRYYLLTKRPQNLQKWSPFPENVWVGVTATDIPMLIEATRYLATVEARIKYISIEPLLDYDGNISLVSGLLRHAAINQVIIGAQTRPTIYPKIEWITEIIGACDRAGVAVFLKYNLIPIMPENTHKSPFHFGIHGLRQEIPNA